MKCEGCQQEIEVGSKFCGGCGLAIEDDNASTRHWADAKPLAPLRLEDEDEIERPLSSSRLWIVAVASTFGIVGLILLFVMLRNRATTTGDSIATAEASASATRAKSSDERWTPPPGARRSIVVPGSAFSNIGPQTLGALYDAKLQRLHGSPSLFEPHEPVRTPRNEITHSFARIRSKLEIAIGVVEIAKGSYRSDRFYAAYRALNIKDVIAVDESKPMRKPPDAATYYLAEIHVGASYDVIIEGSSRAMGAKLDKRILKGNSIAVDTLGDEYRVSYKALGLRPRHGRAIFATTPEEIADAYTTEDAAVPVRLVFRQVPGRKIADDAIPWPQVQHDEQISLDEDPFKDEVSKKYELKPGTYTVSISTRPNGVRVGWKPEATCKSGTFVQLTTICSFKTPTTLSVANPRIVGIGDTEIVDVFIAKGRDPSQVETSQPAGKQHL